MKHYFFVCVCVCGSASQQWGTADPEIGDPSIENPEVKDSPFKARIVMHATSFCRRLLSTRGCCQQFWHGQGCPLFDVVRPAIPLPTTYGVAHPPRSPEGCSFGEAVVARDMLEPCRFPSLHSCQKRFLWTHKEVDLAPHLVVGLTLQAGVGCGP